MADQPIHMWSYWRDKYGIASALTEHYPTMLGENAALRNALGMMQAGEAAIDNLMEEDPNDEDARYANETNS